MILARTDNNKTTVKNYRYIKETGTVLGNKGTIDEATANKHGYYFVNEDPTFNPITQILGGYKIIENKAIREVVDKSFGTLEQEKVKKIIELNNVYQKRISEEFYPWAERGHYDPIPEDVAQARLTLVNECHAKEAYINTLETIEEVLTYEL